MRGGGVWHRKPHCKAALQGALTRMMRKTLRAVATEAWIFFTSPGWPAATNMAAY